MGYYDIVSLIICYNNGEEVVNYIDSMKDHAAIESVCFVITVNSWNRADQVLIKDYITRSSIKIIIFEPENNLGYMNGLIQGYNFFRKGNEIPKYVIMSNTDISIPDHKYYQKLLYKEYENSIGCIGPSIYVKEKHVYDNPTCEQRRNIKEINNIIRKFSIPFFRGFYVYLSTLKGYFIKSKKTESRFVYEVHGCYFILSGMFAEKIKNLRYGVLMYSEEAYIAELIYENKMKTYYDAELEVIHLEHSTTKFVGNSKIANYIYESMKYIRDEFYIK